MLFFQSLPPLVVLALFSATRALPQPFSNEASIIKERATDGEGTKEKPLILIIDVKKWTEVSDAECAAILCFGSPRIMQYGDGINSEQRKASGASLHPFAGSGSPLVVDGSKGRELRSIRVATPSNSWTSPSDTTNSCSREGGVGTLISPVDPSHNRDEGSAFHGELSKNPHPVRDGDWFRKRYRGSSVNTAPHCYALKKNDKGFCWHDTGMNDPKKFMYRKTSFKSGNAFLWQKLEVGKHIYGKNEDLWNL